MLLTDPSLANRGQQRPAVTLGLMSGWYLVAHKTHSLTNNIQRWLLMTRRGMRDVDYDSMLQLVGLSLSHIAVC